MTSGRSVAGRIAELSPAKRAVFEKLAAAACHAAPPVSPRHRSGPVPVSFAQQRLWFLDQMMPGTALFNMSSAYPIEGDVDEPVLARAVNEVVRRHESLRTTFKTVDGEPVQEIHPDLQLELESRDIRGLPAEEREAEAKRLVHAAGDEPFDLERGPLLRALLIRSGDTDYVLVVAMHHIVSDAWSLDVLWDELLTIWDAFSAGAPSPLPEPSLQYADYAVWERERLTGSYLDELVSYWREQLTGLPVLDLPTDWPRHHVPSGGGATHSVTVPRQLADALSTLGQQEGATLFMVLLAAFQALLSRYSGQEDVVVGTFATNRDGAELEPMIGFFVNALVLRADLSGGPSFRALLRQVRRTALNAYAHQALPFARLVQELPPERDFSRNPLFQIAFQLVNAPRAQSQASDPGDPIVDVQQTTAILDLTCTASASADGIGVELEYSTDLFEPDTIERLGAHYTSLLAAIAHEPDRPVQDLPLIDAEERQRIVTDWNRTSAEYDLSTSIVSLFEQQAGATPEGVALRCQGDSLTYRELNRRANRLARHLVAIGVQPEAPVGICMDRSIDLVVAVLAVLKAGAAYVPLDAAHHEKRLARIVEDARPAVVLCDGRSRSRLPQTDTRLVDLDSDPCAGESAGDLHVLTPPDSLAYVIYTSGSTGSPKGVAAEHRQVLNRLHWMWDAYPFADDEVACQKTALGFVDSVWELLGPLLKGVPTVIIPAEDVRDPKALVAALSEHEVTRIWLVPSLLRTLLETWPDLGGRLPALRFWVASGEPLTSELVDLFETAAPDAVLYNLYGTSEVWDATWYDPLCEAPRNGRVPIGRPISNVQAYVLDGRLEPVPPGIPGELHIGGVGLARGYLQDPGLTAAKFVPNPFANSVGSRLYKTGDLARHRADGNIEFLGRVDQQVKLRGFRVELGEIEAALRELPTVRAAVVVLREDTPGEPRLVAYVARDANAAEDAALATTARRFLRQRLPEYLVPTAFVTLPELPLTATGKIDRRALPRPDRELSLLTRTYVAPRSPVEAEVADIWAELLGVDRIGMYDSFFDLGGHSLLGIRALSRVSDAFQVEIPFRTIFETPTVADVASLVDEIKARGGGELSPIVPLSRADHAAVVALNGDSDGSLTRAAVGADKPFGEAQREAPDGTRR
jgi:amino acid adenylation domain-containing protein